MARQVVRIPLDRCFAMAGHRRAVLPDRTVILVFVVVGGEIYLSDSRYFQEFVMISTTCDEMAICTVRILSWSADEGWLSPATWDRTSASTSEAS